MENQHKKIDGYRDFDESTISDINVIKSLESAVAARWRLLLTDSSVDVREMALARSHFENGFIHMVKAIAKPESPWEMIL
jgi:hypothetical protein